MRKVLTYLVLIVMLLGILYAIRLLVLPEYEKTLYGDRLEGIEVVDITELSKIDESLSNEDAVEIAISRIQGKIINVNVTIKEFADTNYIKGKIEEKINALSEDILSYYDIQIFIKKDLEETDEYLLGYKNKLTSNIVWTN